MLAQELFVLYIGNASEGARLAKHLESLGWIVYLPTDVHEALGMYTIYFPSVIILEPDGVEALVAKAYFHLRSINARPMLALCTDANAEEWYRQEGESLAVLPSTTPLDRLAEIISETVTPYAHA